MKNGYTNKTLIFDECAKKSSWKKSLKQSNRTGSQSTEACFSYCLHFRECEVFVNL